MPEDCKKNQQTREISKATQNNSDLGLKYSYCTDDDAFTITKILSWLQE